MMDRIRDGIQWEVAKMVVIARRLPHLSKYNNSESVEENSSDIWFRIKGGVHYKNCEVDNMALV